MKKDLQIIFNLKKKKKVEEINPDLLQYKFRHFNAMVSSRELQNNPT